jgi:hypothetical protein
MNDIGAWKLYLDDLRYPSDKSYTIARSVKDTQKLVNIFGVPTFISFDHDLGVDTKGELLLCGYDFVKWLVQMDMDGLIDLDVKFTFEVHSKNPVGAENIRRYLEQYLNQKRKQISLNTSV